MELRLGMSPISWSNDDLSELGADTPLETCLAEIREAGFSGTESGGKFPKEAGALSRALAGHGLALVSGWYGGTLIGGGLEPEIGRIAGQLELFREVGASAIVYGETFGTVHNRRDRPLAGRPKLSDFDVAEYGRKLTALAEHCAGEGVPLALHHHMGTAVESEAEIDAVMAATGEAVGLLLDTGHLAFAGGDSASVIARHGKRINHVHAKDVRAGVLAGVDPGADSFLDCVLRGVFTVPGDGTIDYGDLLERLHGCGYGGWVVVEAEQDPAKANPLEYAKAGYRALDGALRRAGYSLARP